MLELFETAIVNHDFGIFDGVNSAAAIHSPMSTFSCAGAHPIHRLYDARCISTRNTSLASMTLSPDSRDLLLSIFKAEPNARCAWEWRDFLKAMSELGFDIEQVDGVVFRFKAPERWQNQVVVLHMRRIIRTVWHVAYSASSDGARPPSEEQTFSHNKASPVHSAYLEGLVDETLALSLLKLKEALVRNLSNGVL
ncbi:hypothetical protein FKP32DRAFT_1670611 [Trametes sanguinea]|nr:hypothetical protein FKP32DRAFT_1670611 [Trametes sanguinea]